MKALSLTALIALALSFTACDSEPQHDETSPFVGTWVNAGLLKSEGNFCQLLEDLKEMTPYEQLQVTGYKVNLSGSVFAMNMNRVTGYDNVALWNLDKSGETKNSRFTKANKSCVGCEEINKQSMALNEKNNLIVTWSLETADKGKFSESTEYTGIDDARFKRLQRKANICMACSDKLDKVCSAEDIEKLNARRTH